MPVGAKRVPVYRTRIMEPLRPLRLLGQKRREIRREEVRMMHEGTMGWMMGGMAIWAVAGILLVVLLVVVILKLLKK